MTTSARKIGVRLIATGLAAAVIGIGAGQTMAGASLCGCTALDTRIAYARDVNGTDVEVFSMASNGSGQTRLTTSPGFDGLPSWSPNRSQIVFVSGRASGPGSLNFELFVMDANGANPRRLTTNPATDTEPAWSPTSNRIAFSTNRDGNAEIYVVNADGSGLQRLTANTGGDTQPAWSPDGSKIVFVSDRGGAGTRNLFIMNADGTGVRRLTTFAGSDENPSWSPDGTTVAFSRILSGNTEVHVVNASGTPVVGRVTNRPGFDGEPTWSPDGRIAFASTTPGVAGSDIRVIRPDGTGDAVLTAQVDFEGSPAWGRIPPPIVSP